MDLNEVKVVKADEEIVSKNVTVTMASFIASLVKNSLYFDHNPYKKMYAPTLRTIHLSVIATFFVITALASGLSFVISYFVVKNTNLAFVLPGIVFFLCLIVFFYKRYNIVNNFKIRYLKRIVDKKFAKLINQREYIRAVIDSPDDANHWKWIKLQIYELRTEIMDRGMLSYEDKEKRYKYSTKLTRFSVWGTMDSKIVSEFKDDYKDIDSKIDPKDQKYRATIESVLYGLLPKYNIQKEEHGIDNPLETIDTEYNKILCA